MTGVSEHVHAHGSVGPCGNHDASLIVGSKIAEAIKQRCHRIDRTVCYRKGGRHRQIHAGVDGCERLDPGVDPFFAGRHKGLRSRQFIARRRQAVVGGIWCIRLAGRGRDIGQAAAAPECGQCIVVGQHLTVVVDGVAEQRKDEPALLVGQAGCGVAKLSLDLLQKLLPGRGARFGQGWVRGAGVAQHPVGDAGADHGAGAVGAFKGDGPAAALRGDEGGHFDAPVGHKGGQRPGRTGQMPERCNGGAVPLAGADDPQPIDAGVVRVAKQKPAGIARKDGAAVGAERDLLFDHRKPPICKKDQVQAGTGKNRTLPCAGKTALGGTIHSLRLLLVVKWLRLCVKPV